MAAKATQREELVPVADRALRRNECPLATHERRALDDLVDLGGRSRVDQGAELALDCPIRLAVATVYRAVEDEVSLADAAGCDDQRVAADRVADLQVPDFAVLDLRDCSIDTLARERRIRKRGASIDRFAGREGERRVRLEGQELREDIPFLAVLKGVQDEARDEADELGVANDLLERRTDGEASLVQAVARTGELTGDAELRVRRTLGNDGRNVRGLAWLARRTRKTIDLVVVNGVRLRNLEVVVGLDINELRPCEVLLVALVPASLHVSTEELSEVVREVVTRGEGLAVARAEVVLHIGDGAWVAVTNTLKDAEGLGQLLLGDARVERKTALKGGRFDETLSQG